MTIEIKPTTFARGVPKEQHNGFFGIEDRLLALPIDTQITAVVTYRLSDDITKKGAGIRYPVLAVDHIEPIWDDGQVEAAKLAQEDAYKDRTGENELDFSSLTVALDDGDDESQADADDAAFEAAAPKKKPAAK